MSLFDRICAKDLDNCEFDFSNCSNVQSGESCEIKCNPPYVLAAAWQNRSIIILIASKSTKCLES